MTVKQSQLEILALIPARGGSRGISRKNLVNVAGKPLIAYSIEQAIGSRYITRVIVSTDDTEIAEVARRFGVRRSLPKICPPTLTCFATRCNGCVTEKGISVTW